jgi:hypothetical protein
VVSAKSTSYLTFGVSVLIDNKLNSVPPAVSGTPDWTLSGAGNRVKLVPEKTPPARVELAQAEPRVAPLGLIEITLPDGATASAPRWTNGRYAAC